MSGAKFLKKWKKLSLDNEKHCLFRVRCEAENWKKFMAFLETCSNLLVAVYETPRNENPHIHALIESDKSEDAIKRARTRFFKDDKDMKGNGVASISSCDRLKEYKEYLAKGRYAVKEKGLYKKAEEPQHNVVSVICGDLDWQQLYNDFWTRHEKPITKTQQKKRFNYTEELLKECEKTFELVEYRYVDNYSKEILRASEDDYESGWYNGTCLQEIDDLKSRYKQYSPRRIVKWLIDFMCHRSRIFDDFMITKYLNLIVFKYRHHFASTIRDTSARISNILQKAGFETTMRDEIEIYKDEYEIISHDNI